MKKIILMICITLLIFSLVGCTNYNERIPFEGSYFGTRDISELLDSISYETYGRVFNKVETTNIVKISVSYTQSDIGNSNQVQNEYTISKEQYDKISSIDKINNYAYVKIIVSTYIYNDGSSESVFRLKDIAE